MKDPRYSKLSALLVQYSTAVRKGDRVLLDMTDTPDDFTAALIQAARAAGGIPIVETRRSRVVRELLRETDKAHASLLRDLELRRMKQMQVYIAVRGAENAYETSDVPSDLMTLYQRLMRPVLDWRVRKTRWVVLRWPTASMAQAAGMSTEAFEDFYFDVCTLDYRKMDRAMRPLQRLMEKTDQVRIKGPGTDLVFSIKGMPAIPCSGSRNIPDGEVFTCPVKHSVNGVIRFNAPTAYAGKRFENIVLEFKNGRVVRAEGSDTKRLNKILDTDPGARYVGEFSFGLNPRILDPMGDILFDEKIAGSIHFTPGQAYEESDNGNRSAIHWDMVLIQRPEWGGGEIWFDGKLIRKDGRFLPKALQKLNPENLV
ncbi:MAG: aminopeptidase [Verrucomicrobia bacterium]|nr:aminopeptidase [Verrucomicrobiota bacterium]